MPENPTKTFFQDKLVLLLLSLNFFAVIFAAVVIGLRLTSISSESYFVKYSANFGEVTTKTGGIFDILLFIIFAILVVIFHVFLAYRTYKLRRQLALVLLGMSVLLVSLSLIVGNALLALR